jgi:hypothetical protein
MSVSRMRENLTSGSVGGRWRRGPKMATESERRAGHGSTDAPLAFLGQPTAPASYPATRE